MAKKYCFYNVKDENFKIVSINGVVEFPEEFAISLATLLGEHHSIALSSRLNNKTEFTNKVFKNER